MKQLSFEQKSLKKPRLSYGGELKVKGRKFARPVATRFDMHLVLKSHRAKGALSLYKHRALIDNLIKSKARKFFVHVKEVVNMGNHLHLRVRVQDKKGFGQFLKVITCLIARNISGAKRGKPFGRFWQGPAFTRILTSAIESLSLKHYFEANRIEFREGYLSRQIYLDRVNRWIRKLKKVDSE